jgi:glycosyltransferase involved in cell wall biosynthesis
MGFMIEVLLATRNGAETLGRTLASFEHLRSPQGGWRLIAVDNGSSDATPALLERYRARLPLTVLREPRPGKNIALNRALPLLRGAFAVFVDDDVLASPDWLLAYEAVAAAHPDCAGFAGRITAHWECAPPRWVLDWVDLRICYGIHAEIAEGPCTEDVVYGANMAVRTDLFRAGLRFDEYYGPNNSASFAMGGETELARRVAGQGLWFTREACVQHIISSDQFTREWLLNRAFNFGRGQCRVGVDPYAPSAQSVAATLARIRRAQSASRVRGWLSGALGNRRRRFLALWHYNYLAGVAVEYRCRDPARAASGA